MLIAGAIGNEPVLLRKAVTSALQAAVDQKLPSVAFPLISSGIFSCPAPLAARLVVTAVVDFLEQMDEDSQHSLKVRVVCRTHRCF